MRRSPVAVMMPKRKAKLIADDGMAFIKQRADVMDTSRKLLSKHQSQNSIEIKIWEGKGQPRWGHIGHPRVKQDHLLF